MKKIFLLIFTIFSSLFSSNYSMSAEYDVSYGVLGNVGIANASYSIEKSTYKILIKAKATGLAKLVSRGRVETYESIGIVKDGVLVPQIFLVKKKRGSKVDTKRYMFDYKKHQITLLESKKREDSSNEKQQILPFFTHNDILSLFFNLKNIIGEKLITKEEIELIAVGASKKDGKLNLHSLKDKEYKMVSKLLGREEHIISLVLNQKIFSSQKGEMFLNLNDDGICTSAVLKDVIMFGDIKGVIKKLKVDR